MNLFIIMQKQIINKYINPNFDKKEIKNHTLLV